MHSFYYASIYIISKCIAKFMYLIASYRHTCAANFCTAMTFDWLDWLHRTGLIRILTDQNNSEFDAFGSGPASVCALLNFLFQFVIAL